MYLTPYQKKQFKFVLALLLGIPATIFLVYKGVQYISMADADPTPKEVIVSNVTTHSLTLTWVTEKEVEAYVVPVLEGTELSPVADARGEGKRFTHYVELKSLEPDTQYSFVLLSDEQRYTSGSVEEYKFTTAPISADTPVPNPIHGTVVGDDIEEVIVYAMFADRSVYPVSVTVASSGNWLMDLSVARQVLDKSMASTTDDTEMILLARGSAGKGVVLEGTFGSLFDSNGKLNSVYTFEVGELANFTSFFPPDSVLGEQVTIVDPPEEWEEEPEEEEVPEEEEEPEEEEPTTYIIKQDVAWEDMVSGDSDLELESGEATVMIVNVTDVGFTIVWRSAVAQEGYAKYGTSTVNITNEIRDIRDGLLSMGKYRTHYIESGRLEPETTYYVEIYSGDSVYSNGGDKYIITTYPTLSNPPAFETRSGKVINASDPSDWVVVFKIIDNDELGTMESSAYKAVLPDSTGDWNLTIGDARSEDGLAYFSYSNADILQAFFVGSEITKFDFVLSQEDLELDILELGGELPSGSVKLLTDYGIIDLR